MRALTRRCQYCHVHGVERKQPPATAPRLNLALREIDDRVEDLEWLARRRPDRVLCRLAQRLRDSRLERPCFVDDVDGHGFTGASRIDPPRRQSRQPPALPCG